MKAEHGSVKYWRCPDTSCQGKGEFELEQDFVSHLQKIHHESVPPDDISFLISACFRSSPARIRSCPLCPRETVTADVDTESLLSHIACHVHSFSLRSLPWVQDDKNVTWVKRLTRADNGYFVKNSYFDIGGKDGSSAQDQDTLSDRSWEGLEPLEFDDEQPFEDDSNTSQITIELPPVDHEELHTKLRKARIEYPAGSHRFFVPESEKNSIITEETIASEIYTAQPHLGRTNAMDKARLVHGQARNLFAVLAYLKKGSEICAFIDEGITDEDLPFGRDKPKKIKFKYDLQRKDGSKINALDDWKPSELDSLAREQWYMIAPVFGDTMAHHVLHDGTVLPFIAKEEDSGMHINQSEDGCSDMFTTRIHTSHLKYHGHWVRRVSSVRII